MRVMLILIAALALLGCGAAASAGPTPEQAVDAIKAAGVAVGAPRPVVRDDMGMAPYMHDDSSRIAPVVGGRCAAADPCNVRVLHFANEADAAKVEQFYVEVGKAAAFLGSHTWRRGRLVVQFATELGDADAARIRAALDGLR